MRRVYRIMAAVVMIAGLGAVGLARAPLASAAPCWGVSCNGLDPATTGCNQYYSTPNTNPGALATVVNWYSTGCNANWTQAYLSPSALAAGDRMQVGIEVMDSQNPSKLEAECYPVSIKVGQNEYCTQGNDYAGSLPAYTDMVDGTNVTHAAAVVIDPSGYAIAVYSADQ